MSILSFVGAVHFGAALSHAAPSLKTRAMLLYSVCPSLLAWTAVNLPVPAHSDNAVGKSYVLLGSGFIAAATADRVAALPSWYLRMRVPLTALVVASHAVAMALS